MDNQLSECKFAMTENQKKLVSNSFFENLNKYREFVYAGGSFSSFVLFEFYNLFIAPLPTILGYGLRQLILPRFLYETAKSLMVASNVVLRNPKYIKFGKNVVIDRNVTLDVRSSLVTDSNKCGLELGNNVLIGNNSMILAKGGNINLGNAVNVSSNCRIASEGNIEIGESCLISAYCYIGPGNHKFEDIETPIMEQGMHGGLGIKIGKNVWIGTRVTILDGVIIGDNSVIGAHSLVKNDVPANTIVAGTPAKFIKNR
jgi:acetyltransferase-like isoleucine patch superfamily enzyme